MRKQFYCKSLEASDSAKAAIGSLAETLAARLSMGERCGIDLLRYPHVGFWKDRHIIAIHPMHSINHPEKTKTLRRLDD